MVLRLKRSSVVSPEFGTVWIRRPAYISELADTSLERRTFEIVIALYGCRNLFVAEEPKCSHNESHFGCPWESACASSILLARSYRRAGSTSLIATTSRSFVRKLVT